MGVERCGGMKKNEEGCGRVKKNEEGCGRVKDATYVGVKNKKTNDGRVVSSLEKQRKKRSCN